jgi:hypothetical protein
VPGDVLVVTVEKKKTPNAMSAADLFQHTGKLDGAELVL